MQTLRPGGLTVPEVVMGGDSPELLMNTYHGFSLYGFSLNILEDYGDYPGFNTENPLFPGNPLVLGKWGWLMTPESAA